jgi:hypothetical protein
MRERIERLRGEIARLRKLALTADTKAAADLRSLANDMEQTVSEMEDRLDAFERGPLREQIRKDQERPN